MGESVKIDQKSLKNSSEGRKQEKIVEGANDQPNQSVDDIRENKDIAAVSYMWILSIVIFSFRKDSAFVQFHARQGSILFVFSIVFWIIPFIGRILEIFVVAGMIMGFIYAVQGQYTKIPLVSDLASGKFQNVFNFFQNVWNYAMNLFKRFYRKEKRFEFPEIEKLRSNEQTEKKHDSLKKDV